MALNKSNKFGVPISDTDDTRQGLLQPKFANRYRVRFYDLGRIQREQVGEDLLPNVLTGQVESFTRPSVTFSKNEARSFIANSSYAGRPTYEDISLVIRDEITNSVITGIYNQLKLQTYKYQPFTFANGTTIKSPYLGMSTKFDMALEIMDGSVNYIPLETWIFLGCQITAMTSNNFSYETDTETVNLNLQVSFDFFEVFQPSRTKFASNAGYKEGWIDPNVRNANDEFDEATEGEEEAEQTFADRARDFTRNLLS